MDLRKIPFEAEAMLRGLRIWVECESPTFDAAAVNRMMDIAARDLAIMGARIERIAGDRGFGDCVRARFPHRDEDGPGILILGHFDTVHPIGTLAKLPWRRDGNECYGPGILDMKAGNYVALEAVRQLLRIGEATALPITVLFTSDEEVGSPSTRSLIEAEAARQRFVLIPEPARADGGVVSGRYAIARFNLETIGRPSHAGASLSDGRSAIREMARKLLAIEAMTTADCTFSVGVIRGGGWVNCVPTSCVAECLTMAKRQEDLDQGVAKMLALAGTYDDVVFDVTRGVTRPVWAQGGPTMALYETAKSIAESLGSTLSHQSAGGGSDGNFTGSMGIATLDGLGAMGNGFHTLQERIDTDSLVDRARLWAGLLTTLA